MYSYKSKKENLIFKLIKSISNRLPNLNKLNFTGCLPKLESGDTVTKMTMTESDVDQDLSELQFRTNSYRNVMKPRETEAETENENTVIERSVSQNNLNLNNEQDNDSNLSGESEKTTASEKKVKVYARKLESIFTVIFLFSFIVYTIIMFAFIPIQ